MSLVDWPHASGAPSARIWDVKVGAKHVPHHEGRFFPKLLVLRCTLFDRIPAEKPPCGIVQNYHLQRVQRKQHRIAVVGKGKLPAIR